MRHSRIEELVRAANYHGEGSGRLYLAGEYENALIGCGHSVDALEELHRADRSNADRTDVLADRLRDRAEIRREVARTADDPAEQCRLGIADITRAIELRESLGPPQYPLWVPNARLQRAEFHAHLGAAGPAQADAAAAVAAHRAHGTPGSEESETHLAVALSRQAEVLALTWSPALTTTGSPEAAPTRSPAPGMTGSPALAPRREAVALYRAHDTERLRTVHEHRLVWTSTPTWPRFCATAADLARDLGPPHAAAAPEALLALQDAAEGFADPTSGPDRFAAYRAVRHQVAWLRTLDSDLAPAYLTLASAGAHLTPADLHPLRPRLEALLAAT